MDTRFNDELRQWYVENAQPRRAQRGGRVRISALTYRALVDDWVERELACPRCGARALVRRPPVREEDEVANCDCQACGREYYLIDAYLPMRGRARCNSYRGMLGCIEAGTTPDVMCLQYDREASGVIDLFVVPGTCLRKEHLALGIMGEPEEGHDTWCDIEIGRLRHELGDGAIVDILHEGRQIGPDEVVRRIHEADALG